MRMRVVSVVMVAAVCAPMPAQADSEGYDRRIQAAALKIAVSKLGDIRGSIDHEDVTVMAAPARGVRKWLWTPPKPEKPKTPKLEPVTDSDGVDDTRTAGIKPTRKKVIWERFDRYGNPIQP